MMEKQAVISDESQDGPEDSPKRVKADLVKSAALDDNAIVKKLADAATKVRRFSNINPPV
jgi:hypothetical protein